MCRAIGESENADKIIESNIVEDEPGLRPVFIAK
jgi:hypothetical protein